MGAPLKDKVNKVVGQGGKVEENYKLVKQFRKMVGPVRLASIAVEDHWSFLV